jgi:glycosyltransferase involved in cell wall biosynthesis
MKVLHFNTERTWRGGEQQTLYLMQTLKARGIESHLVCQPGSPMAERAQASGLSVFPVRTRGEVDLGACLRIRRLIGRHGYDLLHAHTSHAHSLAFLSSLGLPVRRLVTRRVDYSIFRHSFLRLSGFKYRRMAHHYIAISRKIRAVLIRDGIPAGRITVVPSGVDPARFESARADAVAAEFGLRPRERVVINAGHLVGIKGQRYLVQAIPRVLEKVPEARFFIIGGGPLQDELATLARSLGLGERLVLTGFRPDVGAFYRAADLFVMSSTSEGLGTAVLDAMALGIPVVASRAGGIPEAVADGVTGRLVPPADPAALAAGIVELLTDAEKASRFGRAGRERVLKEFSLNTMADRTVAIYDKLMGEGTRDGIEAPCRKRQGIFDRKE